MTTTLGNLYPGQSLIHFTGTYTDLYQLTMAQVYFLHGRQHDPATFDYFFRQLPFEGGYAVFAGLEDLLESLENLRFDPGDLAFLREQGFGAEFLHYLQDFRFTGTIYSVGEGDVVFPTRPILRVEANLIEAQIIETLALNILNFQTLIATKASRMRLVAGDRTLVDFGLRRAQGVGGYYASRAAMIGGFEGTSNVRVGRDFNTPVSGTMAHSFVQGYDDELAAFRDFAESRPDDCVLLVDTYNTLASGIPNAIQVGKEMESRGQRLKGIRLDSGDLAYLSKKARQKLDEAGLNYVKIAVSNQLDEKLIKSLLQQEAPIDIFGVGTKLVIGYPDAALDGVYKLANVNEKPRIKLSESIDKVTLPGKKQVYRMLNGDGSFMGADAVALADEKSHDIAVMHHPFDPLKSMTIRDCKKEPLLLKVMEHGKRTGSALTLQAIAAYSRERLGKLPGEYKRFENPHLYKVGLSNHLKLERDRLIAQYQKRK
ncbi:MAG: nicotinate phosphoribosyltransferase [Cytophagales bacterium]|nr:nicotinate phosphoribosyltransferase [Cytophagales bacterium]